MGITEQTMRILVDFSFLFLFLSLFFVLFLAARQSGGKGKHWMKRVKAFIVS